MTTKRRNFKKGIILDPDTTALTEEGGVKYDDTAKKIQYRDDVGTKSIVSEDGTQTLENKTIDGTSATGNNTITADADNISYDNSTSGLTATDVKAAIDEVQSNIEGKDEASEISYDNTTSGLTATNVQAAIDEVDGDLDTHIANTSAHGTTGNVVGTSDTQTLTNKTIDADSNTISNIDNADIKAGAAIDATKIADGSVTSTEFQYIGGLTSDAQTQLDNKLSGIGASSDNRIIRNDGTSGNTFQESLVSIDDAGVVSGATQLNVDNIRVDGNTISSTDTNGNVELSPDGTGITKINSDHQVTGNVIRDMSTDAATGSNVTLTAPSTKNIRLTNGSLSSIDMIPAGTDGQEIVLINATGNQISINDSTGATAANQIKTGTQAAIQLSDEASIPLVYDGTEAKWMVSAGVGGSDSIGDKSIYAVYDAENQDVTGFTNISITTSSPINETASYSVDAYTASLPSITLNDRNLNKENNVRIHYTMTSGTAKLLVKDNSSNTLIEQEITASSDVQVVNLPFYVKSSVTSVQLSIESVSSPTGLKIDDITFSDDPFFYKNLEEVESANFQLQAGYGSTNNKIPYFTNEVQNNTGTVVSVDNSSTLGLSITALKDCYISISYSRYPNGTSQSGFTINSTQLTTGVSAITDDTERVAFSRHASIEGSCVTANVRLNAGDVIRPHTAGEAEADSGNRGHLNFVVKMEAEHILTPAKSNLSDWEDAGTVSITDINTSTAALGTTSINKVWKRRVGDSMQVRIEIEQTASGTGGSGDYVITIPGSETIDSTKIGRISNSNNDIRGAVVGSCMVSNINTEASSSETGNVTVYSSTQVRFQLDEGVNVQHWGSDKLGLGSTTLNASAIFTVPIEGWDSNATFLAAIPVQKTAYIKDVKAANTAGGTFTSGSWQTRDLNTIEGDGSFLSISSNQFTLPPGKYNIEANAPALSVDRHKIKLRNITDSTDDIIGHSGFAESDATYLGAGNATLQGQVEITTSKTFELQHRCQTTRATNGFGLESNFGVNEVYSVIKIEKIK